ncbi:hypothetical protein GGF42_001920 [Coemansia sp. RSA 2424]|nr:hypothetical protein GGF42_001920 [Coemansia sp. RSA 2424]
MSTLSPLQILPSHVAKLIVNYVVGSSRLVYDGIRVNSYEYNVLLRPLLWVCHNLRAIALPLYCNRFKLFIYSLLPDVLSVRNLLPRNAINGYRECNYLGHPTHHLARKLEIEIDEQAVYSDKALRMLSTAPYDGSPFLQARKLALIFIPDRMDETGEDVDTDPLTVETNVAAFVQRVKQMAPKVSEIRVQPACYGVMEDEVDSPRMVNRQFSNLVSRLFQLVGNIEYGDVDYDTVPIELRLDNICNLVHIKLYSVTRIYDILQFIHLARQNAQTLQSLCMRSEEEKIDFSGLVQYADGRLVTYPCLRKLQLRGALDGTPLQQRKFPGAVPFPNLRSLLVKCVYPFSDDTLFRGNAATLEVLEIQLTHSMASILRKYSVFAPTSHPKLQCVKIWCNHKLTPDAFAPLWPRLPSLR